MGKRWHVCTVSSDGKHNWEICKEISAWGLATNGRKISFDAASEGDNLLIYQATAGFIAYCVTSSGLVKPTDRTQTPWAGGLFRYGAILPFKLKIDMRTPLTVKFSNLRIADTQISVASLRRGFSQINVEDGTKILEMMKMQQKRKETKDIL